MIKIQGMRYLSDFEAKKAMTDVGRQMAQRGYVIATDGSLSVRTGPNGVWITAADAPKGTMSQDMMVKVDLDGKPMMGSRVKELPEEMKIHLKIYRENPDIRAVIHGYPPIATAMGIQGKAIDRPGFTKTLRILGRVPVIPCTDVDMAAQTVSASAGTGKGVLLQNNGCMSWGGHPQEAYDMLEAMEYYGTVVSAMGQGVTGYATEPCKVPEPVKMAAPVYAAPVYAPEPVRKPEEAPCGLAFETGQPRLNGVTELVKPGFSYVATSDVIHSTETEPEKPEKAFKKPLAVTEKPKADVMAEVVRRTMESYHG